MAITNTKGETLLDERIIQSQFDEGKLTPEEAGKLLSLAENILSIKSAELHNRYDQDIKELTGKDKPHGVKTYDHLKSVISDLKSQQADPEKVQAYQTKIQELESKLEAGIKDDGFKQKAMDLEARVEQLTQAQSQMTQEWEKKIQEEKSKNTSLLVDFEFQKALASEDIKFKPSEVIPEPVRETFIKNAIDKIMSSSKPDFVEENGKTSLIFRDGSGQVINNPEASWSPFTAKQLLLRELTPILDKGHKQSGGGTGGSGGSGGAGGGSVDVSGAKSQAEAAELITQGLMAQGLARGTKDFQEALDKHWTDDVKSLPVQ